MRRAAPPPMARIDPTDAGPWSRVTQTPRGLGLTAAPAPAGAGEPDERILRPTRAVPHATHQVVVVNDGAMSLSASPGIARTLRLPDMMTLFDRRPPGLAAVLGAARANAGMLRADDGWRATVLPSMGDVASDLGHGPVAMRADGRCIAVVHEGAVYEITVPGAETSTVETTATPSAMAYDADDTLRFAYGAGLDEPADGAPIVELAASSGSPRLASLDEAATITVWEGRTRIGSFASPLDTPHGLGVSADGRFLTLSGTVADEPAVCVLRTDGGALARHIGGARTIALMPDGVSVLVGGDWGMMLLEPPREA